MSRRATRVSLSLPRDLLARATEEAARHDLTLRELLAECLHAALAERCCQHDARPVEPPPSEPEEAES